MADGPTFQAPYFAQPERRLGPIPDLFVGQRGGTSTPMTLPGQQLPVWALAENMKKGVEAGQMALKSKQVASEAAARAHAAEYADQQFKAQAKFSQWLDKNVLDEGQKAVYRSLFGQLNGFSWTGTGGGELNPAAGTSALTQEALKRIMSESSTPEAAWQALVKAYSGILPNTNAPAAPKTVVPQKPVVPPKPETPQKPKVPQVGGQDFGHTSTQDFPQGPNLASTNVSYPDLSGSSSNPPAVGYPSLVNFFQQPNYQNSALPTAPTMTA